MAIDPSISLGVRPPVIQPLQIQNPLEQYGKILSLRNLMTEQQSGQLGLQAQQLKLDEAQKDIAQQQSLRDLLTKNPNASAAEVIGAGGLVRGPAWIKAQADAEKARLDRLTQANTLNVNNAKRRAQIAAGVTDLEGAKKAAWQAANEGVYDIDPAKNAQIARDVLEHLQTNGFNPDEWKQHAQESLDYAARQDLLNKADDEKRKADEAAAKLPGLKADTAQKVRADNATILAGALAQGPQAFADALAKLKPEDAAPFAPAKTVAEVLAIGSTPHERITADQATAGTELTELEIDGKPHKVLVRKGTGEVVRDLGLSGFKPQQVNVNANASLLDRESARFAKPHEKAVTDANTQLEKISEARSLINGPATAQALGIPKVLSSLVGGAGSGLRMTKAELDSIAKARGITGDVEGFINKVSGAGTLTSEQQRQLTGLLDDVAARIQQKQTIANDALDRINSAGSREEIVRIDSEVRRKLAGPQNTATAPRGGQYKAGDTRVIDGKTYTRDANGNWK